jgi:hypothetical protein
MNKKLFHRLVATFSLGLLAFSNHVVASGDCGTSFYQTYQNCVASPGAINCSPFTTPEEYVAGHPQCFPGGSAASQAQVSSSSFQQAGLIFSALSARRSGTPPAPGALGSAPVQGMAAGGTSPWNVWGNVSLNDTEQTYRVGANLIRNEMFVTNTVIGVDYTLAPGLVLGISGAYDRGDSGALFNTVARVSSASKGFSIAPYLGYQLTKELALDVSAGMGAGQVYSAGGAETDSDRFFYGANLSYSTWMKDWQLTGKLGYMFGQEESTGTLVNGTPVANTAGVSKVERWQIGGQAAYWLGNGVQPFAGITYLGDSRRMALAGADPIGKSAWQYSLGLNFFSLAKGITGGLLYTNEFHRSNQKNDVLGVNIGIRY